MSSLRPVLSKLPTAVSRLAVSSLCGRASLARSSVAAPYYAGQRPFFTLSRSPSRFPSAVRPTGLRMMAISPTPQPGHLTPAARALAAFLNEEYRQEEVSDAPAVPEGFTLKDFKGENMIYMKKEIGDEKIVIRLQLEPPDDSFNPDEAKDLENMENRESEYEEVKSGDEGKNQQNQAQEPEAKEDPQEEEEEEEEDNEGEPSPDSRYIAFEVIVTKPKLTSGALVFDCVGDVKSRQMIVNRVIHTDAIAALEMSPSAIMKREGAFQGPVLMDMPLEMVTHTNDYLQERGITEEMIAFLWQYFYYKEQKEYVNWLKSITVFLTAK